MICPCGGVCREHEVKAGRAFTCNGCGRYEVFPWKTPRDEQPPEHHSDDSNAGTTP